MINLAQSIKEIKSLFNRKCYFAVLILSVQLLELISEYILESAEEDGLESTRENMNEREFEKWYSVYKEYRNSVSKYRGNDSPKVKLLEVLFADFNWLTHFFNVDAALIQKVNRVTSFRNELAHNYFTKPGIRKLLRIRAKDCLSILEELQKHPKKQDN